MPKILLIEDEIEMAKMYKDRFLVEGYEMVLAFTSEEGIKKLKKEKPDLVILDILLPTENGISFLRHIRHNKALANVLVVALSNYDDPVAKKEAYNLGVKDYLIKTDFTPKRLIQEIKKYLPKVKKRRKI